MTMIDWLSVTHAMNNPPQSFCHVSTGPASSVVDTCTVLAGYSARVFRCSCVGLQQILAQSLSRAYSESALHDRTLCLRFGAPLADGDEDSGQNYCMKGLL